MTMRYTVENTTRAGKPARVFDADGNEIFDCVAVDTVTGVVERFKVDANGLYVVTPDGESVARETIVVPGVRVEFKQ